jgi:hypothetical protein
MSLESTVNKPKNINYTSLGMVIGAGIALLLSELGLEVEMSIGIGFGLAIGYAIDKYKRNSR